MAEAKFKVGNKVYAPYRGYGTVTAIHSGTAYPIEVTWDECECADLAVSTFTKDGCLSQYFDNDDTILTVVEKASLKKKDKKSMAEEEAKFKVGDNVWSPHFGSGVVVDIAAGDKFPIEVKWCDGIIPDYDFFTKDGQFDLSGANPDFNISSLRSISLDMLTKKPEEDEGVVERMEDALSKKVDDAINPSHYKVKGLPEAHEIINHLMHREQYEGFLWGNILKYAYRYGRKGDKAETAGKIAWYATQLKELEEEKRK